MTIQFQNGEAMQHDRHSACLIANHMSLTLAYESRLYAIFDFVSWTFPRNLQMFCQHETTQR